MDLEIDSAQTMVAEIPDNHHSRCGLIKGIYMRKVTRNANQFNWQPFTIEKYL